MRDRHAPEIKSFQWLMVEVSHLESDGHIEQALGLLDAFASNHKESAAYPWIRDNALLAGGDILRRTGRYSDAVARYRQIDPTAESEFFHLNFAYSAANALAETGHTEEALAELVSFFERREYRPARELLPNMSLYFRLATQETLAAPEQIRRLAREVLGEWGIVPPGGESDEGLSAVLREAEEKLRERKND
jgi:tetratricopeptide (TPR) repeat protein